MSKLHQAASENYKKMSDEYAKSIEQHIQELSDLQQEYLESSSRTNV
jgi:hypothetical protein